ncbi:hypothetical protein IP84_05285 [beta proteobacterium AAP99]|nr:hypothetical protein IP84_05285 [beta proteobacterium AAP99]
MTAPSSDSTQIAASTEGAAELEAILEAATVPVSDEELARQALAAQPESSEGGRRTAAAAEPLTNEVGRAVWAMEHGVASDEAARLADPLRMTPPDWLEPPTVVAPVLPPELAIPEGAPPITEAELEAQALAASPEPEQAAAEAPGLVDEVGQALWGIEHGVVPPEVIPPPTAAQWLLNEAAVDASDTGRGKPEV